MRNKHTKFFLFLLFYIAFTLPNNLYSLPAISDSMDPEKRIELAISYYKNGDFLNSTSHFKALAHAGNPRAQFLYGMLFYQGFGVPHDFKIAFEWLKKSAMQNYPESQSTLGFMFLHGEGVEVDKEEAFKWMKKAADQDNKFGLVRLGEMYLNGWGVKKDLEKAIFYFKHAASKGEAEGVIQLALMYLKGIGVKEDKEKAHELLLQAKTLGSVEATYRLAILYSKRTFGYVSQKIIHRLFEEAAERGYSPAQITLGVMYILDKKTIVNTKKAKTWLLKALIQKDLRSFRPLLVIICLELMAECFVARMDLDKVLDDLRFHLHLEINWREIDCL